MRTIRVFAVTAALGVLMACDHTAERQAWQSPAGPSQAPTGPSGTSSTRPAIEGTVLVAGGGPLAGATVRLLNRNYQTLGTLTTDSTGGFQFPASGAGCEGLATLRVEKVGYWYRDVLAPGCVTASGLQPVAVTVTVQEELQASEQRSVRTTLSNDDLDWGLCGPCKLISLPAPSSEPLDVTIEWSTSDHLSFWLTASDRNYDEVILGVWQAAPGAQTHTITIVPSHGAYFYYSVLIGLPAGSRATGGLTGVGDLRIDVKPRSKPN
jgi:hypothetical protein